MAKDWGQAIVVDPSELAGLRREHARLGRNRSRFRLALCLLTGALVVTTTTAWWSTSKSSQLARELKEARRQAARSSLALDTLARSHENILAATQHAPSVGTKSWGRRFNVTAYLPMAEEYGETNDGFTATMKKADPKSRIVAVDPKLIPYGSWLWIEGLGWFQAEDCGSAIKGFRLDVLVATATEAKTFGRQDRFVIVVPPTNA